VIKLTSYLPMVGGSPGTPASSKTGRHDIAEILLKVALNTKNQINYTNLYLYITAFDRLC
jgi:hypothetical protein